MDCHIVRDHTDQAVDPIWRYECLEIPSGFRQSCDGGHGWSWDVAIEKNRIIALNPGSFRFETTHFWNLCTRSIRYESPSLQNYIWDIPVDILDIMQLTWFKPSSFLNLSHRAPPSCFLQNQLRPDLFLKVELLLLWITSKAYSPFFTYSKLEVI